MADLGFKAFDADQHYYEAEDAFIRHLDPAMRKRCMQWAEVDGKKRLLVGGQDQPLHPEPHVRSRRPARLPRRLLPRRRRARRTSARRSASSSRSARTTATATRGCSPSTSRTSRRASCSRRSVWAWSPRSRTTCRRCSPRSARSTAGSTTTGASTTRTASTPRPTSRLADVDWAIEELEWALAKDARIINLRASSVDRADGRRSLGHPLHDPFWQRVNDAGITICIHSGDAGYGFMLDYWGQDSEFEAFRYSPLRSLLTTSPISDAVGVVHRRGHLRPLPEPAPRDDRVRLRVGGPAAQEAQEGVRPAHVRVRRGSAR